MIPWHRQAKSAVNEDKYINLLIDYMLMLKNNTWFAVVFPTSCEIDFFAEPLLIGLRVGGGLAALFCGISFVFLVRRRQKNGEAKAKMPNGDDKSSGQHAGKIYDKT